MTVFRDLAIASLIAASLLLVPTATVATEATQAPETVEEFAEAFVSAVRSWDADSWAELVHDDVVMMAPSGRMLQGRQAFHDLWSRNFEGRSGANPLQVEIRDTRVEDDLAVVRADYGPEGAEPVGQYVWTLERDDDGAWSLLWWIFNRRSPDE